MVSRINEDFFFGQVRLSLFDGAIKPKQVEGLATILAGWNANYATKDDRWLAYALGTTHHETGRTMQPIREWGSKKYFHDMYDKDGLRPKVALRLGNVQAGDGVLFHGRGFVQLTGRANYKFWGLDQTPEDAMKTDIATRILFEGMRRGTFTGKKFEHYFNATTADWKGARRIINGLDKADLIASYALKYYGAISYTT